MTKEDTFKKPKAYNQTYMYLCSSLKDSYVRSDELIMAFRNGPYKVPIKSFIKELSRRTAEVLYRLNFQFWMGKMGVQQRLESSSDAHGDGRRSAFKLRPYACGARTPRWKW